MIYTIYFSIFGKNLKTKVKAGSEREAQQIIRDKIIFHESKTEIIDDAVEYLKNIFGI